MRLVTCPSNRASSVEKCEPADADHHPQANARVAPKRKRADDCEHESDRFREVRELGETAARIGVENVRKQ